MLETAMRGLIIIKLRFKVVDRQKFLMKRSDILSKVELIMET